MISSKPPTVEFRVCRVIRLRKGGCVDVLDANGNLLLLPQPQESVDHVRFTDIERSDRTLLKPCGDNMNLCDCLQGGQAEQDTKGERPRHNGLDSRLHLTVPGAGAQP
jgi:hypothetical protein